jgi:hypothetical protein
MLFDSWGGDGWTMPVKLDLESIAGIPSDHFALKGWYKPAERTICLSKPFGWT